MERTAKQIQFKLIIRSIYCIMGLIISIFPFCNFHYKIFRGLSCHLLHRYQKIAAYEFTLPPFFAKYICFSMTDFAFIAIFIGTCILKKISMKDLFFNSHSIFLSTFICAAIFSIIFSIFSEYYIQYITLINLSLAFLGFHLVYALYKNQIDNLYPIFWGILATAMVECFISIGQFFLQHHLGLQFLSEQPITPQNSVTIYFNIETIKALFPWIKSNILLRSHGTFNHPNILGGYVMLTLCISYYLYLQSSKKILFPMIGLQIMTLLFTFSRGAIITWVIGSLLFFIVSLSKKTILTSTQKKNLVHLGLVLGIFFSLFLFFFYDLLKDRGGLISSNWQSISTNQTRLRLLKAAFLVFIHFPILGIGYNNFAIYPFSSISSDLKVIEGTGSLSHNIYLQIGAETGLVGLSLFFLFILSLYKPYIKIHFTPLSLTLAIIVFCMLFTGLFDHFWIAYTSGRLMFFVFTGLFAAITTYYSNQEPYKQELS